jgi:hypothetical protein
MILRSLILCAATIAALTLAGCNSNAPAPQASAPQQASRSNLTPSDFKLPEGSGCSGEVARYRAVIANDHATGNVNDSVYAQIEGEISNAAAACSAGNDGQARALIHASKSRHGYPG